MPDILLKTFLVILNTFTLALVLLANALTGCGVMAGRHLEGINQQNETLITPDRYAFSIWGLIYVFLIIFVLFQWFILITGKNQDIIQKTGVFFSLSNFASITWLFLWFNNSIGFSVLAMLVLLATLMIMVIRLDMEIWDAPVRIIIFVWWPVVIYLGWIIMESVTNIALFLTSLGWDGSPFSPHLWAILIIMIATGIYSYLTFSRNLRESGMVGVWTFVAIAVHQGTKHPDISFTAIIAALILLVEVMYHGYKNRDTSPFRKIKRGEF